MDESGWWWSWVLMFVGVTGLFLAGSARRAGWLVGIGSQFLWAAYAVATRQWGFLVSCAVYGSVYTRNWLRWRRLARLNEVTGEFGSPKSPG